MNEVIFDESLSLGILRYNLDLYSLFLKLLSLSLFLSVFLSFSLSFLSLFPFFKT